MIALTDAQLVTVMAAAASLPLEKRDAFLQRTAARVRTSCGTGRHPTDADVDQAVREILAGLMQAPAA